jgi:hypothetical protein
MRANAVAKVPSSFHAANEHTLNLASRNALLAGAHQMNDLQPKMQGKMRGLKESPHAHSEGLATFFAVVKAIASSLARHLGDARAIYIAAMRANRSVRPKLAFDILESSFFALELRGGEDRLGHGGKCLTRNEGG